MLEFSREFEGAGVGSSEVLVIARNAAGKRGQNRGNIRILNGKRREIEGAHGREPTHSK
jgi:hypothetical protein